MNRAIFLDRDGVIIEDVSYPHKIEDLHIKEELVPHLKWALKKGFKLIIITNQAGIAKGKFTIEQYKEFHKELIKRLNSLGVEINKTYFCPYHKDGVIEPYNIDSIDRKPKPGMILKAKEDFNIDLTRSYMIGDKLSDIIEHNDLKCYVLKSQYNSESKLLFDSIDAIFKEIRNGN